MCEELNVNFSGGLSSETRPEIAELAEQTPIDTALHSNYFEIPLSQISSQFKETRKNIKERKKKETETEILGTLMAKTNPSDAKNAHYAADYSGLKQWNNFFLMKVVCVLTLSAFISGYDIGAVSLLSLLISNDKLPFNTEIMALGTFVALGSFGAAVGALLAGPSVDRFGRKQIVVISDILFLIGGLTMALSQTPPALVTGRLFAGIATGITSMNVPIYISEICPIEMRGRVIAIYTFLVVFGQFFSIVMGLLLCQNENIQWRGLLFVGIGFALIQLIGMFFLPESPRWLANKNRYNEAITCLRMVYKPNFVDIYINSLQKENKFGKRQFQLAWFASLKELLLNYRRCVLVGCGLMMVQQLSGITIVNLYGPTLISNARLNTKDACNTVLKPVSIRDSLIWSLPLGFVRILGTIIAIMVVDRRGRRKVLLRTIPIVFVCTFGLCTCFWLFAEQVVCDPAKWSAMMFTMLFLVTYSSGLDTIPWLVNSEIYPPALLGVASSIAAFTNWSINYLLLQTFYSDRARLYFLSLAVFNLLGFIFVWYFVVETNGNTNIKNMSLILQKSTKEINALMKQTSSRLTEELSIDSMSSIPSDSARAVDNDWSRNPNKLPISIPESLARELDDD